jgi:snapalysin
MRRPPRASVSACLAAAALAGAAAPAPASADPAPIVGGTAVVVGDYPEVVALTVGTGICTGTLIDPSWVVTAAHCLTPSAVGLASQEAVTRSIRVHLGTVNLDLSQGDVRAASFTIPKPGFSLDSLGHDDIGLVKLAQPVTDVAPAPVNFDRARAPIGTVVTMVGFGATATGGAGTIGIEYALADRASTSCAPYGVSDGDLLCFSQTDGLGKCRGDSGGPSFAQLDGRRALVGVTSFGDPDCIKLSADTRTDVERPFLASNLAGCAGDEDCPDGICFDGRCIAPPFSPAGIGTTCTTSAQCDSGICGEGPDGKRCIEICTLGGAACPDGFGCLRQAGASGSCWPDDAGGCCDAGGRGAGAALLGIALVVVGLRRGGPRRRGPRRRTRAR